MPDEIALEQSGPEKKPPLFPPALPPSVVQQQVIREELTLSAEVSTFNLTGNGLIRDIC